MIFSVAICPLLVLASVFGHSDQFVILSLHTFNTRYSIRCTSNKPRYCYYSFNSCSWLMTIRPQSVVGGTFIDWLARRRIAKHIHSDKQCFYAIFFYFVSTFNRSLQILLLSFHSHFTSLKGFRVRNFISHRFVRWRWMPAFFVVWDKKTWEGGADVLISTNWKCCLVRSCATTTTTTTLRYTALYIHIAWMNDRSWLAGQCACCR